MEAAPPAICLFRLSSILHWMPRIPSAVIYIYIECSMKRQLQVVNVFDIKIFKMVINKVGGCERDYILSEQ